jgi:endonuclease YncB( thermonuclease family)
MAPIAASLFSNIIPGKDDNYNIIKGLPHGGVGQNIRKSLTDFGSGYKSSSVYKTFQEQFGSVNILERPDIQSMFSKSLPGGKGININPMDISNLVSEGLSETNAKNLVLSHELGHARGTLWRKLTGGILSKKSKMAIAAVGVAGVGGSFAAEDGNLGYAGAAGVMGLGIHSYAEEFLANKQAIKLLSNSGYTEKSAKSLMGVLNKKLLSKSGIKQYMGVPGIVAGSMAALTFIAGIFRHPNTIVSGSDEAHNTIAGLPHSGVSEQTREGHSFGSGWQGMTARPNRFTGPDRAYEPSAVTVNNMPIQNPIDIFRKKVLENNERKAEFNADLRELKKIKPETRLFQANEMNPLSRDEARRYEGLNYIKGLYKVDLSKYHMSFDDADTLILRRTGIVNSLFDKDISIRLAGIDAPEVAGHTTDPMQPVRIYQDQPFGQEAADRFEKIVKNNRKLELIIQPDATTYGRQIALLYGDSGRNLNLQLVQEGIAAFLPYGESGQSMVDRQTFAEAEKKAVVENAGMWNHPAWQVYNTASAQLNTRITFNTLTQIHKLAGNYHLASLVGSMQEAEFEGEATTETITSAKWAGRNLRKSYGRFVTQPKMPLDIKKRLQRSQYQSQAQGVGLRLNHGRIGHYVSAADHPGLVPGAV